MARGYLVVTVAEATGKNKDDVVVWDPSFVEGFVKVEIRGGAKPVKDTTQPKRIVANSASWAQDLTLEVLDGASELRVMLCRERRAEGKVGTSVVAACGIFVADILDAVPIDKYFELFKPGAGGEGGFVRIAMAFYPDAAALARARRGGAAGAGAAASNGGAGGGTSSGPLARIRSSLSGIGLGGGGGGGDREASAAAAASGGGSGGDGAAGGKKGKGMRLLGLAVVVAAVAAAVVLGGGGESSGGDAKKKKEDEKKKKK